jgi:hypothetical protein
LSSTPGRQPKSSSCASIVAVSFAAISAANAAGHLCQGRRRRRRPPAARGIGLQRLGGGDLGRRVAIRSQWTWCSSMAFPSLVVFFAARIASSIEAARALRMMLVSLLYGVARE